MAKLNSSFAVGDHVRLPARDDNQHQSFSPRNPQAAPAREPVDGLVLSIREVKSGKLVKEATGDLNEYVFELLVDQTFNARFASLKNAPRGSERATGTAAWRRVQAALRSTAENDQLYSTSSPDLWTESPMARVMDGWKVIKVWAKDLESLEQAEDAAAAG